MSNVSASCGAFFFRGVSFADGQYDCNSSSSSVNKSSAKQISRVKKIWNSFASTCTKIQLPMTTTAIISFVVVVVAIPVASLSFLLVTAAVSVVALGIAIFARERASQANEQNSAWFWEGRKYRESNDSSSSSSCDTDSFPGFSHARSWRSSSTSGNFGNSPFGTSSYMPNSFGNNFPFGSSRDPLNGFGNFASSYEEMQDRLKEEFRQSQRQENERLESAAAAMLRQQQRAEDLAVFNLEEGTPREEIKKATDNVTRQYHPDKFSDNFKPEQKEGESDEEYGKRVEEKRVECEEHSKKIIAARGRLLA